MYNIYVLEGNMYKLIKNLKTNEKRILFFTIHNDKK